VVPTRAAVPVLGPNPIAFAAPARRNAPFLLDMATSTVANNKIKLYELNGKPLPPGWVLGGGAQTPLGGTAEMSSHKGYGLALMAHILGGTLSGASFSPIRVKTQGPGDPDRLGHFFLAIDPKAFRPEGAFEDDLHLAAQDEHPLRPGRAMPRAAKPHRAVAQLVARGREHCGEHRLRRAFGERHLFLAPFRAAVAIGVQRDLGERCHILSPERRAT